MHDGGLSMEHSPACSFIAKTGRQYRECWCSSGCFLGDKAAFQPELHSPDTWYLVHGQLPKLVRALTVETCSPVHSKTNVGVRSCSAILPHCVMHTSSTWPHFCRCVCLCIGTGGRPHVAASPFCRSVGHHAPCAACCKCMWLVVSCLVHMGLASVQQLVYGRSRITPHYCCLPGVHQTWCQTADHAAVAAIRAGTSLAPLPWSQQRKAAESLLQVGRLHPLVSRQRTE